MEQSDLMKIISDLLKTRTPDMAEIKNISEIPKKICILHKEMSALPGFHHIGLYDGNETVYHYYDEYGKGENATFRKTSVSRFYDNSTKLLGCYIENINDHKKSARSIINAEYMIKNNKDWKGLYAIFTTNCEFVIRNVCLELEDNNSIDDCYDNIMKKNKHQTFSQQASNALKEMAKCVCFTSLFFEEINKESLLIGIGLGLLQNYINNNPITNNCTVSSNDTGELTILNNNHTFHDKVLIVDKNGNIKEMH